MRSLAGGRHRQILGPFGFGWSHSLPLITRNTDKGWSRYQGSDDAEMEVSR